MTRARGLTLRTKLLISFAGVGLLVIALLLVGNQIMRDAATRLEVAITAQVRPLARLNRLQSQISRIRVLEIELPRLTDLFAVSDQLELLGAERAAFDRDIVPFIVELKAQQPSEAASLDEHWRRYQSDLRRGPAHLDLRVGRALQDDFAHAQAARRKHRAECQRSAQAGRIATGLPALAVQRDLRGRPAGAGDVVRAAREIGHRPRVTLA